MPMSSAESSRPTDVASSVAGEVAATAVPLAGACAWEGADMARSERWIKPVPAVLRDGIDEAVRLTRSIGWQQIQQGTGQLPVA